MDKTTSLDFTMSKVSHNFTFGPFEPENTTWTNDTLVNNQIDLFLVDLSLSIVQIIFVVLGMILKTMIIYFEHFGRDTKKRSLFNRVILKFKLKGQNI